MFFRRDDEPNLRRFQPGVWPFTLTVYGLSILIATIRVLTRVYDKHFGLDDGLIIAAMVSTTLYVCCFYSLTVQLEPPEFHYTEMRHYCLDLVYSTNYAFSMALIKISALIFLRRIGRHTFRPVVTWILYIDIGWTLLGSLQMAFFQIFSCRPLSALSTCWMEAEEGSCINYNPSVFAYSVSLLIGNIPIIILPIKLVRRLQMKPRKKMLIYGLSFLAALDTTITFFRMLRWAERIWPGMNTHLTSEWYFGWDAAMTPIEVCLALITASLPMIYRPTKNLYRYLRGTYVSKSKRRPTHASDTPNESSRYPSRGKDDSGSGRNRSGRYMDRVLYAPRKIKAELYQLDTVNLDDASSSKERVFVQADSERERIRTTSVRSEMDSQSSRV